MPQYLHENQPSKPTATSGATALPLLPDASDFAANTRRAPRMASTTSPKMSVGSPEPVLSRPSPTQRALITPVCDFDESRAIYMNRHTTDAPTSETAIGIKMIALATRSRRIPSARTAIASPNDVESNVTARTHHKLLMSVPRSAVNTAKPRRTIPAMSGPDDALPNSTRWPVWRRARMARMTKAMKQINAAQNSLLPKMACHSERLSAFGSLKIEM